MSKGVISDYDYAERMMRYFVRKVCAFKMIKPRAAVSLPPRSRKWSSVPPWRR